MPAMRRRLFTLCSAVSLLLCAAVCTLWVRSYWVGEMLHSYDTIRGRELALMSCRGGLSFYHVFWDPRDLGRIDEVREARREYFRDSNPPGLGARVQVIKRNSPATESYGPILGLAFFREWPTRHGSYYYEVMIPCWVISLSAAAAPAWWLRTALRGRAVTSRRSAGLCVVCGYDLRASPDRCPECGAAAAPETAAAR
jgi:hypothetical protein